MSGASLQVLVSQNLAVRETRGEGTIFFFGCNDTGKIQGSVSYTSWASYFFFPYLPPFSITCIKRDQAMGDKIISFTHPGMAASVKVTKQKPNGCGPT